MSIVDWWLSVGTAIEWNQKSAAMVVLIEDSTVWNHQIAQITNIYSFVICCTCSILFTTCKNEIDEYYTCSANNNLIDTKCMLLVCKCSQLQDIAF